MLTVIITNDKSAAFIKKYYTFFETHVNSGKIAFCYWNEYGTDYKSALPQLSNIVRGHVHWRAVVALPVNETVEEKQAQKFQSTKQNPYDFLENAEENPPVEESRIPLIRLAQMLGGIPLVNRTYITKEVKKEDGSIVYEPVLRESKEELEKQQAEWDRLEAKYSFINDKPDSLFMIMGRIPRTIEIPFITDKEMMERREIDYSRFWSRNRYPAKTRFLVKDCVPRGHAHYGDQIFEFWMTVLTFCLNDNPIGSIEAYKLYTIQTKVNKRGVQELLSKYYNRLSRIRYTAVSTIAQMKEELQASDDSVELDGYTMSIPVNYHLYEDPELYLSSDKIGLANDCPIEEVPWLERVVKQSKEAFQRLLLIPRVALDKACNMARLYSRLPHNEYVSLNEYQLEQLETQLEELEIKVLTFNTYYSFPIQKYKNDMDRAYRSARTTMRKRMTRKLTIGAGVMVGLIYLIGFIPEWINNYIHESTNSTLIGFSMLGVAVLAITGMVTLICYRKSVKNKISNYNGVVSNALMEMQDSAAKFQDYLTSLCTYMRGRSMVDSLKKKFVKTTEGISILDGHKTHIDAQLRVIKGWMSDFDMTLIPDDGSYVSDYFNFDIPPKENEAYNIQLGDYQLDILAQDGSVAMAPYPFLSDLEIKREEIFEV